MATSLKSKCWEYWFCLEIPRKNLFHTSLLGSGSSIHSLVYRPIILISASLIPCPSPCVCSLSLYGFLDKDTNLIMFRDNSSPLWSHLNKLRLQWFYFQIRSYSEDSREHEFLRSTIQLSAQLESERSSEYFNYETVDS